MAFDFRHKYTLPRDNKKKWRKSKIVLKGVKHIPTTNYVSSGNDILGVKI